MKISILLSEVNMGGNCSEERGSNLYESHGRHPEGKKRSFYFPAYNQLKSFIKRFQEFSSFNFIRPNRV